MKQTMIRIGNFFFRYRNRLFPLIVLTLFALATPGQTFLASKAYGELRDWLAIAIALSGLAVRGLVIGYAYIKRGGLNKKVYADNLVTEGLFGVCRNPLYVGNMLIYAGVFLLHGNIWVAITGTLVFALIYQCIILAEEAFLENKFGEGYTRYCSEVARWVPDISKFREATEGMKFNIARAIQKDYSTIATTLVMLVLAQMYKYLSAGHTFTAGGPLAYLGGGIVLIGLCAAGVRVYKKRAAAGQL